MMKLIDLTMNITERTPVFPGDPKPEIKQFANIPENGWNEKRLAFNSHFGTHIDAPFHMLPDGKKLTDFPIDRFVGEAVVIDARGQDEITTSLESVKEGDIVFFYTGRSESITEDYARDWPVIGEELAREIVRKKARIIGIDTPSPDKEPYDVHKTLLGHDVLIVENLANLKELVEYAMARKMRLSDLRFECFILPLKIRDADGAPCRVVARLP